MQTTPWTHESRRPTFHFTPERNWINDPNGLVYLDGEYHLFYQYNPFGDQWGHMSWGHAVSRDLVQWDYLPVALLEQTDEMIFSGSGVYDARNTSGLGLPDQPPLVAIYTGHRTDKPLERQRIAYSLDNGRHWADYDHNPVLDEGLADFRDPKVFWHEPSDRWIMVVAAAKDRAVRFYGSGDLRSWEHLSTFGPAGHHERTPNWECPDLIELPIEGEAGESSWVLIVSTGGGAPHGGSGVQYFVGGFDGVRFTQEHDPALALWVDRGADFYAPLSWSNIPQSDRRLLWIGWMANHEYAGQTPTFPWRGTMSVPRELRLVRTPDGLRLAQLPVREIESLRGRGVTIEGRAVNGRVVLDHEGVGGDAFELVAEFDPGDAASFGFHVFEDTGDGPEQAEATTIGYDTRTQELSLDRSRSGHTDFHPAFAARHTCPLEPLADGRVRLRILVDTCSVEVFANDGVGVVTDLVFSGRGRGVSAFAEGGAARLVRLDAYLLGTPAE